MQQVSHKADPAPSRWSYRLQRLMLTPLFRTVLRVGVPFCLTFALGTTYLANDQRREQLVLAFADIRHQIETRPEFTVELLAVEGASAEVEEDIREIFPYDFPVSSFDLELDAIQEMIVGLPPVIAASVHIRQGGVLVARVTEREPVALWRNRDGLSVVDIEGIVIGEAYARSDWADLPIVAGEGAEAAIPEALQILRAASPLQDELRGLVRIGERRWDIVLKGDQRILLPEQNPTRAVERVIVLQDAQEMLERDVVAVDMRLAERPTVRMSDRAVEEWWRVTKMTVGAN